MTESPSSYKTHKLQDTTTAISYMDMQKIGGTCYMFFKEDGKGKYDTIGCSNLEWSGGGSGSLNADRIYSSTFEANEIYNLDTSYDEDSGFTYLSYGETLDKYPVIAVMNGTTMLYKERLFESTTENNKVFTLSSHYFLGSYTLDNGLYAQSYSVGHDGTFTEEYYRHIFVNSGFHDLIQMPTTYDNYLLSFEDYDDLSIRTMGIGIVPPPGPEETSVTIKDENTAYSTDITSTTTDVPVTCDYESFGIKVNYELSNITYSYTRYYLRDLTDTYGQFDLDVYLINPYTTDYVTTNVLVDDLRTKYSNSRILFEKNIDGTTTQITAFDLDLEDKTRAVLMTDEIYYVYIDSDETTKQFLGKFLSAQAGTIADYKVFSLYDIQMQPNFINLDQKFNYGIFTQD